MSLRALDDLEPNERANARAPELTDLPAPSDLPAVKKQAKAA